MKQYMTVSGDTWDNAAAAAMGDEAHMGLLMAANPEHSKTVIFAANTALRVPETPKPEPSGNLPPWRR